MHNKKEKVENGEIRLPLKNANRLIQLSLPASGLTNGSTSFLPTSATFIIQDLRSNARWTVHEFMQRQGVKGRHQQHLLHLTNLPVNVWTKLITQ